MAVDLADYVGSLRREVTQPGSEVFEEVGDDVFAGYLTDAFWECRLDGLLAKWTADEDGVVTPIITDYGDIGREHIALILLYAGIKIVRNQLLSTNTRFRAKAGPVEFETENSAAVLTEMLRQLKDTKLRVLEEVQEATYVGLTNSYYERSRYDGGNFYGNRLAEFYDDFLAGGL